MPTPAQIAGILQQDAQLLRVLDANFADSARRSGEHLVCHPGCTQCCYGAFAISPLDALRLRTAMATLTQENQALAGAIEHRAKSYLKEFAAAFPGDPRTGVLGTSEAEQEAFEDFANEAACPALDPATGLCDLYAARPMTCRVFGPPIRSEEQDAEGLAVCELCFTQAAPEEIVASELQIPHKAEQRIVKALSFLQNAKGEDESASETIVAYCLIPAQNGLPE
jgi:Fe-S-cluster containining protein